MFIEGWTQRHCDGISNIPQSRKEDHTMIIINNGTTLDEFIDIYYSNETDESFIIEDLELLKQISSWDFDAFSYIISSHFSNYNSMKKLILYNDNCYNLIYENLQNSASLLVYSYDLERSKKGPELRTMSTSEIYKAAGLERCRVEGWTYCIKLKIFYNSEFHEAIYCDEQGNWKELNRIWDNDIIRSWREMGFYL